MSELAAMLPGRERWLARRAAAGEERAFAAIFRRYHQELYRYCRAILNDSEDAEDAMQATMVKALRALPGERREIAIKPWLYRVAHNESISILRARRETAELDPEVAAPSTVEATAQMRERMRTLVRDLATLPERQRATLVMRELNDLSYEEIGEAMAITPAAARQAVYEARTALLEVAEGREMECTTARSAISAGDRRVLRGRKIRAHVCACERCRAFEDAIGERREVLAALAPPLAGPVAMALLHGALGAGSAGGAGAGGAGTLGAGVVGGTAIKGTAAVLAVAAVGGGAAATGVLDRHRDDRAAPSTPAQSRPDPSQTAHGSPAAPTSAAAGADRGAGAGGNADPRPGARGDHRAGSADHRRGRVAAAAHATAGKSGAAPGHSRAAPGQTVSTEGPVHANAGGDGAATAPGRIGTAPGQTHSNAGGGGSATAPGQAETAPGNGAIAPGHDEADTASAGVNGNAAGHATAPGQAGK